MSLAPATLAELCVPKHDLCRVCYRAWTYTIQRKKGAFLLGADRNPSQSVSTSWNLTQMFWKHWWDYEHAGRDYHRFRCITTGNQWGRAASTAFESLNVLQWVSKIISRVVFSTAASIWSRSSKHELCSPRENQGYSCYQYSYYNTVALHHDIWWCYWTRSVIMACCER